METVEVQRGVTAVGYLSLHVDSTWLTGTEFEDVVPGSAYLLCWFGSEGQRCCETVGISEDINIMWY